MRISDWSSDVCSSDLMTGLELYRHLIAVGTPIPTVLVTAYPDEAVRARALKAGSRCYLAKPLEPDALLGCIRSALASLTGGARSEEHTSELQSLMRISYAVFFLQKKINLHLSLISSFFLISFSYLS